MNLPVRCAGTLTVSDVVMPAAWTTTWCLEENRLRYVSDRSASLLNARALRFTIREAYRRYRGDQTRPRRTLIEAESTTGTIHNRFYTASTYGR